MKKYDVVAVLWRDHLAFTGVPMIKDPDIELDTHTLNIGLLHKETDKCVIILSEVEPYSNVDNCNYMLILKSDIVAIKKFGTMKLKKLRT